MKCIIRVGLIFLLFGTKFGVGMEVGPFATILLIFHELGRIEVTQIVDHNLNRATYLYLKRIFN